MKTKKLALLATFTALALIIHIIEAQIPLPIPVPGVKLGLANTITLFMLFFPKHSPKTDAGAAGEPSGVAFKNGDILIVLFCRIMLGAIFTGRLLAFAYSAVGGVFAITAQIVTRRFVTEKQAWVCGAIGAAAHNIGQILAAMIITGTPSIVAYLPVLIIAGIITGVLTGFIAGWTARAIHNSQFTIHN